jgi:holliday junction DNA helicase RuvA
LGLNDRTPARQTHLQATRPGYRRGWGRRVRRRHFRAHVYGAATVGAEAALHIHTQVSDSQIALFGFLETDEKRLFERLITVSGVGPKLAIKILSGLNSERVIQAIRGQDHAQLTHIPGVGKKLAERLVVELKDKLDDFAVAPTRPSAQGPAVDDVLSALTNLGYQRPAAEKAIEQAIAKDKALAADFDGLFRGALKIIR